MVFINPETIKFYELIKQGWKVAPLGTNSSQDIGPSQIIKLGDSVDPSVGFWLYKYV